MPAPPRLAARLLRLVLEPEDAEVVIGDLEELFTSDRLPRDGARAARRWYWRQTASVIWGHVLRTPPRAHGVARSKGSVMAALRQDFAYAIRGLRKQPGFTATAVLTLALGIGVNIAIFAVVNAVLFKPLPFHDPDQLMRVHLMLPERDAPGTYRPGVWSWPKYRLFRDQQQSFQSTAILAQRNWNLTGAGDAERLEGELVEWTYFETLGVAPRVGRTFTAGETRAPGSAPLAVLGYGLWTRRFRADPGVVGQTIGLNAVPHTIVGVLPPGFHGLTGQAEVWVPVMTLPASDLEEAQSHSYSMVARRKSGRSDAEADAETRVLGGSIDKRYGMVFGNGPTHARAMPLHEERVDPLLRRAALTLFAAVVAVLLIACVNLANLTLVRALARQREVAIRLALGATRVRIVRQLMAESVLLACGGAVVGLMVAWAVLTGTATLIPDLRTVLRGPTAWLTRVGLNTLGLDGGTLLFTAAVTLGTAVLFGLIPAWRTSRRDVTTTMKSGAAGAIGQGTRGLGTRNLLIAAEMALALVLLAAAGLMLKSVARLQATELGFRPEGVLTFRVQFPAAQYDPAAATAAFERLLERLARRGEIDSVAYGFCAPVSGGCNSTLAGFPGQPPLPRGSEPSVGVFWGSPALFDTLGIRLIRGRLFTDRDRTSTPKVVVINETAARRFWKDQDPIGQRISVGQGGFHTGAEVIGVVADVRYRALETAVTPDVYLPLLQSPRPSGLIFVRSAAGTASLVPVIRQELQALDADLPLVDVRTMNERFGDLIWRTRLSAWLLGAFSALALILAAVGMYGVMSQATEQRTREIGVRMALGAGRGEIFRMVVGRAAVIGVAGAVSGIAIAIPATKLLTTLLYEVKPGDPAVLGLLAAVLLGVAVVASYLPARRASRVDPLTTLRAE